MKKIYCIVFFFLICCTLRKLDSINDYHITLFCIMHLAVFIFLIPLCTIWFRRSLFFRDFSNFVEFLKMIFILQTIGALFYLKKLQQKRFAED